MSSKRKPAKYWKYTRWRYCVLCGRTDVLQECRPLPKPKDYNERNQTVETACGHHFA